MVKEDLYTLKVTKKELAILGALIAGVIADMPVGKNDRGSQFISSYTEEVLNLHNKIVTAKKG